MDIAKTPKKRLNSLRLLAAMLTAIAALAMLGFYLVTLRTGRIAPEQMAAWNRELPAPFEETNDLPIPVNQANDATPRDFPATGEPTSTTEIEDFWLWLEKYDVAAAGDPRFRAWRELAAFRLNQRPANRLRILTQMKSPTPEALRLFREECVRFHDQNKSTLALVDSLLDGGPLPWPSPNEAAKVRLPLYGGDIPPYVSTILEHAKNLAVSAAMADSNAEGKLTGLSVIRIAAIDRRFHVEPELPAFLGWEPELDLLGELVGEPGIGLFSPASIHAEEAAAFLRRFPEPLLDSVDRGRRLLARRFLNDRLRRTVFDHGFREFVGKINHNSGPLERLRGDPHSFRTYVVDYAHLFQLRLIYPSNRTEFMQSLVNEQKKVVEALQDGAAGVAELDKELLAMFEALQKAKKSNFSPSHWTYLHVAQKIISTGKHNDQRLMLHAAMTARANSQSTARALEFVRQFSARHDHRVEAQETSQGLRLFIGERSVHIPTGAAN